jgi:exodeoxyribonuclease V gamma subunit
MEAAAVADWLDRAAQDEVRGVTRVGGGMAMGGFKPMRAIPCRVLAVLGLHDAAFPRRSRAPAWDLLAAAPRPGDREPVLEDRQLFLDALLAAGDRVILTATARNIRSNKDEPLSACVDEMLRVAATTAAGGAAAVDACAGTLIDDHPLQPFNARCFIGERASFDRASLDIAEAGRERQPVAAPFQTGVVEPPDEVRSADLELNEVIALLKDPWTTWLASLGVVLPREGDDPFALDREPVAAPSGLNRWQMQTDLIVAVLAGRTSFLEERLAADRLMPYGDLGAAMSTQTVRQAKELARRAILAAGGRLRPHRLVYRAGHPQVAGNITVSPDRSLHVLVRPTILKDRPHHRLDVWLRAIFASACGLTADTLIVSRDGDVAKVDRLPPIDPAQARTGLDALLRLCEEARRRPLPFAPQTSEAIAAAARKGGDEAAAARKVWIQHYDGPPGDGERASAKLAWRNLDPFADDTIDEWRRLAADIFGPVDAWFARSAGTSPPESANG